MKAAIGTGLVALALGVGLGYLAASGGGADAPATDAATDAPDPAAEVGRLEGELANARRDLESSRREARERAKALDASQAEIAGLRKELAAARSDLAAGHGEQVDDAAAGDDWRAGWADGPRYDYPDLDEALAEVNWVETAEDMSAMVGLISQIVDAQMNGKPVPTDAPGKIQQHNGRLVTVFMRLQKAGVPGSAVNGPITHPAVMVNAIAATLEAAGLPLSAEQSKSLGAVGTRYVADEAKRVAAYDERTLELRKSVDEAQLKGRFFDDAFALLSDAQRDALSPPVIRGRIRADLFSEGLLWVAVGGRNLVGAKDGGDLAAKLTDRLARQLRPDDTANSADIRAIVDNWIAGLPADVTELKLDEMALSGTLLAKDITRCADHVAKLYQRFLDELDLSDDQRKGIRETTGVFVIHRIDG